MRREARISEQLLAPDQLDDSFCRRRGRSRDREVLAVAGSIDIPRRREWQAGALPRLQVTGVLEERRQRSEMPKTDSNRETSIVSPGSPCTSLP